MRVVARDVGNFATNVGVSVPLPSSLTGQRLSDASHDLATLPLTFAVMALVGDLDLCAISVYQV